MNFFALQEKIKKDHHIILRAVKEIYAQSHEQNKQEKATNQGSLNLLKQYKAQLTDAVSQLNIIG